eukprot:2673055-Pleurochrysis_carterae.AAC.5
MQLRQRSRSRRSEQVKGMTISEILQKIRNSAEVGPVRAIPMPRSLKAISSLTDNASCVRAPGESAAVCGCRLL